jgi:hypothetical protein
LQDGWQSKAFERLGGLVIEVLEFAVLLLACLLSTHFDQQVWSFS